MSKIISFIIFFTSIAFTQSVTLRDIEKLSNTQLDEIRNELQKEKLSDPDLTEEINSELNIVSIANEEVESDNWEYFGYSYLDKSLNFFDNIPVDKDFILGPGDQVVLSLWGETNLRKEFVIDRDGNIFYDTIGFINFSNKNLSQATKILTDRLSSIYSTLSEDINTTQLSLGVGVLKSINVYFSGEIENPGINLIHPLSDIFSALSQVGVKESGSLRNVQLIRNNKIINKFDFYSFFIDGKNTFSNVRILDGDVIHVPVVPKRVNISGQTTRTGYFELLEDDSLYDLISYAGGLQSNASSKITVKSTTPMNQRTSDDNAFKAYTVNFNESENFSLNNGDRINILQIGDVDTDVTVLGQVKFPNQYPANQSLKSLLDLAGGFDDPIYRKTIRDDQIIVIRKDENEFYGLEFKVPYSESASFELIPGDKIFVYENTFYNNLASISVQGEVIKRGSFQLTKGMTVKDAINLAEGFSPLANELGITVTEVFTSVDDQGNKIEEKQQVNNASLDFELTDGSVVNVLPLENVVRVEGNVYSPGLITYSKGKTVNKYINLAGGPKPNTLSTKIYVKRANGRIKKVTFFQGIGTIVRPGDSIFVPENPNPSEFDVTSFTADILAVLSNLAAILVIVDNNN